VRGSHTKLSHFDTVELRAQQSPTTSMPAAANPHCIRFGKVGVCFWPEPLVNYLWPYSNDTNFSSLGRLNEGGLRRALVPPHPNNWRSAIMAIP
jgi:hypothetical protein